MKKRIITLIMAIITVTANFTACGIEVKDSDSNYEEDDNAEDDDDDEDNEDDAEDDDDDEDNEDDKEEDDDDNEDGDDKEDDDQVKHIAKQYESKAGDSSDASQGYTNYMACTEEVCTEEICTEEICTEEICTEEYIATDSIDDSFYEAEPGFEYIEDFNTEEYSAIKENGFCKVSSSPLSTFSADVDTASYSNLRRYINSGYGIEDIPAGLVRTEEMLNYFSYDYVKPEKNQVFGVNAEISTCPWNEEHELLMLGLSTENYDFSEAADSNIVFLIDVSGSMYDDNKLPLLKKSFEMMIDNLTEKDKVSIVTYASGDEIILEGVPATEKDTIIDALESLEAGGGTNGANGIITAYEIAEDYYIKNGNNRVIIATDGDFNLGLTSESDLEELITAESENGIFLSVLGFGMGNYSDTRMETLADSGNGNYAYIDNISEAKKVLVEELGANMVTLAKDVKLQLEFNPKYVSEYRLIGYEDRLLNTEDFEDDTKDAGEVGQGHSVTVMYEIIPATDSYEAADLKYQEMEIKDDAKDSDEWFSLSIRYKDPDKNKSKLVQYPINNDNYNENPSDDFIFASSVVMFSELIRESEYSENISFNDILDNLEEIELSDDYKEEFYDLVCEMKKNSR